MAGKGNLAEHSQYSEIFPPGCHATILQDHPAEEDDELNLLKGDVVKVISHDDSEYEGYCICRMVSNTDQREGHVDTSLLRRNDKKEGNTFDTNAMKTTAGIQQTVNTKSNVIITGRTEGEQQELESHDHLPKIFQSDARPRLYRTIRQKKMTSLILREEIL